MLNPKNFSDDIRKHLESVSDEEFREDLEQHCPDLLQGKESGTDLVVYSGAETGQLALFDGEPTAVPLDAYLACALSGLTKEQRQLMFQLSDAVAMVCEQQDIRLYEPRKKTDPVHHTEVPDADVFQIDRERVLRADLLIHLCHYPSTGSGEELGFAYDALLPIILISPDDSTVSRMITGIPSFKLHITYSEPEDLRRELQKRLMEIRPILVQRKLAFSDYDRNIVGEKVRLRREALGLTREDVASRVPHFPVEVLRAMEESTDRHSNPSLVHLRQLATVLQTTVADLVEPDISDRIIGALLEWVEDRKVARYNTFSDKDRKRILTKVLARLIQDLQGE